MSDYRELLIGCGRARDKRLDPRQYLPGARVPSGERRTWRGQLETLDYESPCEPTYVWDLNRLPWSRLIGDELEPERAEPLPASTYDEIHAYEVLEHLGQQGDFRAFLGVFEEMYRLLKPDGFVCATCPSRYSPWLWGDPGHTRAVTPCSLVFLSQKAYQDQAGRTTMTDYRRVYRGDFDTLYSFDNHESHVFVLQAVKPARGVS